VGCHPKRAGHFFSQFPHVVTCRTATRLTNLPIAINDVAGNPVSSMRSQLRRLIQKWGRVDIVFVDYIGLIPPDVEENKKENLVCYNFGSVSSNAFSYYPSIDQQIEEKDVKEVKENVIKLTKVTIGDKDYAVDRSTMKVYNLDEYNQAVKDGEGIDVLTAVGTLKKDGRKYVIE
jgi:hypothetical protein